MVQEQLKEAVRDALASGDYVGLRCGLGVAGHTWVAYSAPTYAVEGDTSATCIEMRSLQTGRIVPVVFAETD